MFCEEKRRLQRLQIGGISEKETSLQRAGALGGMLSDVMDFLFKLETVEGIDFKIDVQKPPRSKRWECSISFDGKSTAEFNADICLFLEQWEEERSELRAYNSTQAAYKRWKEQTLAYYAANAVKCTEPEELDCDERIAKRTAFLEKEYGKNESNE